MSKALVTRAVGPHVELLEIAMPTFERFAERHGYEVVVAELQSSRPPSWHKIPALLAALDEYEEALWVDADVVIVDDSDDLPVPKFKWQALVAHHTNDGEVPNCGVWLVRQPMRPVLEQIWKMGEFVNHAWWEQAAVCQLLGYRGCPLTLAEPGELVARTAFLGKEWNGHINDPEVVDHPRFRHATMHPDRTAIMREWTKETVAA